MGKKGQITIFIIIGIVLLLIIGVYFLVTSDFAEKTLRRSSLEEVPLDIQPIKAYIDSCIEQTLIPGVYLLGLQGGYIYLPEKKLKQPDYEIAYSLYKGNRNLVSISTMEKQISEYMDKELPLCLDLSLFEQQGFTIIDDKINTDTTISEDNIFVDIDYNLEIEKQETRYKLERFSATVPIRLGHIHIIADNIIAKSIEDPDWIDLTFLSSFDVSVSIIPISMEDSIYAIIDNTSVDNIRFTEPFIFLIANKHLVNLPPKLNIEDIFALEDSKPFILQVEAVDPENDILTFSDDTAMFDITEDGIITFIPEVTGTFPVTITVEDTHLNKDSKEVLFIVNEKD